MVTGLSGRLLRNCFTWSARRVDWTVTIRLSGSGLIAIGVTCARPGDPCWRPRIHSITRTYSFIGIITKFHPRRASWLRPSQTDYKDEDEDEDEYERRLDAFRTTGFVLLRRCSCASRRC